MVFSCIISAFLGMVLQAWQQAYEFYSKPVVSAAQGRQVFYHAFGKTEAGRAMKPVRNTIGK